MTKTKITVTLKGMGFQTTEGRERDLDAAVQEAQRLRHWVGRALAMSPNSKFIEMRVDDVVIPPRRVTGKGLLYA